VDDAKKIIFVSITVVGDSSLLLIIIHGDFMGDPKNIPTMGPEAKWSRCPLSEQPWVYKQ